MALTSRELVYRTLRFDNPPRAPRCLWSLPIATKAYPEATAAINRDFPGDLGGVNGHPRETPKTVGDPWALGEYIDEWGCKFTSIQAGIVGEVRDPQVKDWKTDAAKVHFPREWCTIDRDAINRDCAATSKFVQVNCGVRPFEQLQFIRGTANLYMDLADDDADMRAFLKKMHALYTELFTLWSKTDADALFFMDDWGSQNSLLISPNTWREYFKPLYREYAQIAHGAGKKLFMHSDGNILSIYPDLIEIGVDAVNSQLFCMGIEKLAAYAGKITFWGEIDRQHLLPSGTPADIDAAVKKVHGHLWKNGGCIAQCEFGPGAKPENVRQVFASWDEVSQHGAK